MQSTIRKWGNSAGAIIPVSVLSEAKLSLGDVVDLDIKDGEITLKRAVPEYSLEQLLKSSPKGSFEMDAEGRILTRLPGGSRPISDPL